MLPPGHVAAGYLTAKAVLKFTHYSFTRSQHDHLILWGMFFSFAPDLDTFVTLFREKAFIVRHPKENNHRKYLSHVPVLWLVAGLVIYFVARSSYWKIFGLLVWLGSWSHFVLDSLTYGIAWLWPLTHKIFAVTDVEKNFVISETTFFGFWWDFIKQYAKTITFYAEIIIIVVAIITLVH